MNWKIVLLLLFFARLFHSYGQDEKKYHMVTVAFYNLENLFDYEDDPHTFDDDRTPDGRDHWTEADYHRKLLNMAKVLVQIGTPYNKQSPVLIGLCEIENRRVLEDLLNTSPLREENYDIIHFDSPDLRGVDVALLYKVGWFTPTDSKPYPLKLIDSETNKPIYTRDQLLVSGLLAGEKIHLIVNHWPSRRGGEEQSRPRRLQAALLNKRIADSILVLDPYSRIISMGDFNDDPTDSPFKKILNTEENREKVLLKQWFNPMESMYKKGLGTLAFGDSWNLFDQILLTKEWLIKDYHQFRYFKAGIFNPPYLTQGSGKYKGYPFKSFSDGGFSGGYSDHFPVYIYLIREITPD